MNAQKEEFKKAINKMLEDGSTMDVNLLVDNLAELMCKKPLNAGNKELLSLGAGDFVNLVQVEACLTILDTQVQRFMPEPEDATPVDTVSEWRSVEI